MTHRLPASHGKIVATTISGDSPMRRRRVAIWISFLALVFGLLLNGIVFAQTETELSEEEAAARAETEAEAEFDLFGGEAPISLSQLRQMQEHFADLASEVMDATVSVQVGQNQGTGVIVTRDGYIMTAAHVIGGANRPALVKLPDGTELSAKTLGLNRRYDSGLLKIDADGKYPYLTPGISQNLKTGQWVMAIGHPGGWEEDRGLVYRVGRILNLRDDAISTDCSLVGGDSGGPLVDMNGEVIGIHSRIGMRLTDNVHVPVDVFSEEWDDLASARDWGRGIGGVNPANEPWLGLSLEDDSMVVEEVTPEGPADRAGLQKGDRLISLDGDNIRNQRRFRFMFDRLNPGDKVTLKIQRDGEQAELELTVGSRADAN
jgi:serine protease Do